MKGTSNIYSPVWFEFFHFGIDQARTNREVEFVSACTPLANFPRILDVSCGMGRHCRALAQRGYKVTGVDRDQNAISKARELGGGPNYIVADIRDYDPAPEIFDAAIVMGQSFGHFDAATNQNVLFKLATSIREGGRIILDLWNPAFFLAHQGERDLKRAAETVREVKRVDQDRLFVELEYPDGSREKFEWQLFTPEQMEQLAKRIGLRLLRASSGFNTQDPVSDADPRTQFALQRHCQRVNSLNH